MGGDPLQFIRINLLSFKKISIQFDYNKDTIVHYDGVEGDYYLPHVTFFARAKRYSHFVKKVILVILNTLYL